MIRILALVLFAVGLQAQTRAVFTAARSSTGTSEKVTIQQPASGSRTVRLKDAYVYCGGACDVAQTVNGTAATTTALTVVSVNPDDSPTAKANAFHTSNVGAGTAIAVPIALNGFGQPLDLDGIVLDGDGTGKNYTISVTASTSTTIRIMVRWAEY